MSCMDRWNTYGTFRRCVKEGMDHLLLWDQLVSQSVCAEISWLVDAFSSSFPSFFSFLPFLFSTYLISIYPSNDHSLSIQSIFVLYIRRKNILFLSEPAFHTNHPLVMYIVVYSLPYRIQPKRCVCVCPVCAYSLTTPTPKPRGHPWHSKISLLPHRKCTTAQSVQQTKRILTNSSIYKNPVVYTYTDRGKNCRTQTQPGLTAAPHGSTQERDTICKSICRQRGRRTKTQAL